MKYSLLLTAAFLLFNNAFGQPITFAGPVAPIHTFNPATAAKGTGTASRLIASASSAGIGNYPLDSAIYTYSNGRGGDVNHPPQFDSKIEYTDWDTVQQAFITISRRLNTYNAANRVDTQLFQLGVSGSFADAYRTTYYYDAPGRDTAELVESFSNAWVPVLYTRNTYDNSGHLTSQTIVYLPNSGSSYRTTWTYNAAGRLTSFVSENLSNGIWVPVSGNEYYTYDAANRLVQLDRYQYNGTSTPYYSSRLNYHYAGADTSYQYTVASYLQGTGGSTLYTSFDSTIVTARNSAGNILTTIHYSLNGGPYYRETYTYTPANLTASFLFESSSTMSNWTPEIQKLYSYNSYDQLTHRNSRTWNGSAWISGANDSDFRYYYEEYQSNLGVPSHTAVNNLLKVWPVPAQGTLMLQFSPLKPGVYTAELSDITGRKVMSWQGTAGSLEEQSIDVSQYPPGVYILRISCGDEVMTRSFTVGR